MMQYPLRRKPILSASGRIGLPFLPLRMQRPTGGPIRWKDFKVDTGADRIIVPTACAVNLGIDLDGAEERTITAATGTRIFGWEKPVDFLATDAAGNATSWTAPVLFAPIRNYLAGHVGFLEFFDLHLLDGVFQLDPRKHLLPGRTSC